MRLFLNEKCADALCLEDFVNQIRVQLEDLAFTSQHGKKNGLIRILGRELDGVGVHNRPLHCTDVKRQTLYIKDEGEWSKTESTKKVGKLVKGVEGTQYDAIREWEQAHPEYRKGGKAQDEWLKMVKTLGDPLDERDIGHVSRECSKKTHLDKEGIKEQ